MALTTEKISLPKEVVATIAKKTKDTSVIAKLSPSEPQLFADKDYMVFNGASEAEVVGEGKAKSSYEQPLTTVVGKRVKLVTTTRVTEELKWADEDNRLEIIRAIQADQAAAIGRALDYVVFHGFDPKKKAAIPGVESLVSQAVEVASSGKPVEDIDLLADALTDEYDISGVAVSKTWASQLRKERVAATGQRLFPEIPLNLDAGFLDSIAAATSGTVNGRLITPETGILAIMGDYSLIRWGLARDVRSEIIEFGDPDNTGEDLKGHNQIAYRTEALLSYAVIDPKAFAVLKATAGAAAARTTGK
ncbi:phage major capsid protein [Arcanobacterium haemolyticum]|nr:phage major capsid protein [Arcanobacterium haemolyticum]